MNNLAEVTVVLTTLTHITRQRITRVSHEQLTDFQRSLHRRSAKGIWSYWRKSGSFRCLGASSSGYMTACRHLEEASVGSDGELQEKIVWWFDMAEQNRRRLWSPSEKMWRPLCKLGHHCWTTWGNGTPFVSPSEKSTTTTASGMMSQSVVWGVRIAWHRIYQLVTFLLEREWRSYSLLDIAHEPGSSCGVTHNHNEWGHGVGSHHLDSLSPLSEVRGALTARRYVEEILRLFVLQFMPHVPRGVFLQDNSSIHTDRISQTVL